MGVCITVRSVDSVWACVSRYDSVCCVGVCCAWVVSSVTDDIITAAAAICVRASASHLTARVSVEWVEWVGECGVGVWCILWGPSHTSLYTSSLVGSRGLVPTGVLAAAPVSNYPPNECAPVITPHTHTVRAITSSSYAELSGSCLKHLRRLVTSGNLLRPSICELQFCIISALHNTHTHTFNCFDC